MRGKMRIPAILAAGCLAMTALFGCSGNEKTGSEPEEESIVSGGEASGISPAPLEPDKYTPLCEVDDVVYRTGLCISEMAEVYKYPARDIQKRLELYRECGFETIRVETYWDSFEPREGEIVNPHQQLYLYTAKEAGFRFKLILGTIMSVPQWYYEKYPGSRMKDMNGREAVGSVSFFAPGLRETLAEKLDVMMSYMDRTGFLDNVDTLVVDCGQGGEGIYPPEWTQYGLDAEVGEDVFWGYDDYSQANFRQTMQAKYSTIEAANAAWGKNFGSFDEVEVPRPGGGGGAFWEDYLLWYRDSKRQVIEEQILMFKAAVDKYTGGRIKLILYTPGRSYRDEDWQAAVERGDGNGSIRLMCDNRFIIDMAKKYGCWLHGGYESREDNIYYQAYMKETGAEGIPIFGENSGQIDMVKRGTYAIQQLRKNGLAGIDLTHSRWLFEKDNMTPARNIEKFKENMRILKNYLRPGSANT